VMGAGVARGDPERQELGLHGAEPAHLRRRKDRPVEFLRDVKRLQL
jgi:hypothetical protein